MPEIDPFEPLPVPKERRNITRGFRLSVRLAEAIAKAAEVKGVTMTTVASVWLEDRAKAEGFL